MSENMMIINNKNSRIKKIYSKSISAWFEDIDDEMHIEESEDSRMTLIEVKMNYISY